ncbi:MAG: DUF547 domain-containing protein [Planctomycetes bacterium]|nr:DUF547 domain-containing protein [Planctomycetota bacterium]
MTELKRLGIFGGITLALAALAVSSSAREGATVVLGKNVNKSQQVHAKQIDHSQWTTLLQKYVDDQGMVDYARWKASAPDTAALDAYLEHLSAAAGDLASAKRSTLLAFWINAYNAVTVRGILREYPTTSIRNHTAKVFGYNIWKDLKLLVAGRPYSLDEMEHEILRKMKEPRIHFAIVCAAMGCPRLLDEAYVAEKLEQQLDANAQAFFSDSNKFRFDAQNRTISVSPILDWFGEDFGSSQAERLRRIAPYLPDAAAQELAQSGNARVT